MDYNFDSIYAGDRQPWEPITPFEWFNRDPLGRAVQQADMLINVSDQQVVAFHAAWTRCPSVVRTQIFREREIAAKLVLLLRSWRQKLPALLSVGVGKRLDSEPRLCAVITTEARVPDDLLFQLREEWAGFETAESVVPEYRGSAGLVPLYVDVQPPPTLLGLVPAGNYLFGAPDPTPASAPVVQSGDRVGSQSPSGIREFGTLACLVSTPGSADPLVLSSGHVFVKANYDLVTSRGNTTQIGNVQTVNMDCDAAIGSLHAPYLCDYRLKVSDMVPAAPVLPTNGLAVQLHGAVSGTQTGFLNQVNIIPANAKSVGIVPLFTANITCARGDSGALLVTGIGKEPPVPAWQKQQMSAAYLDAMTCAILGILMAGPLAGGDPMVQPQAYFSPAVQVFSDLGVEAWVR